MPYTEKSFEIAGIPGRLQVNDDPRIMRDNSRAIGTLTTQKFSARRHMPVQWAKENNYPIDAYVTVEIRFDDECGNRHNTFAITGTVTSVSQGDRRDRNIYSCGCIHDEIAATFPELAHLIRWHLFDGAHGPTHYIANTCYFASNRDAQRYAVGEPYAHETFLTFGDNPIRHSVKNTVHASFMAFLQKLEGDYSTLEVVARPHVNRPGDNYDFSPNYSFDGFGDSWYNAPFESQGMAERFLLALKTCDPRFISVPTQWGKEKPRNFKAARSCAVWPDATDDQLSLERPELTALLEARLPALVAEFRRDIEAIGFLWTSA